MQWDDLVEEAYATRAGSQLFWTTHSNVANRASALRDRLEVSLPRYVVNRGYRQARSILDAHRVCIIAGVPGIGKTMLAQVLLADAISTGYEPVEVSGDIDEAWTALHSENAQVFLYDDFLGQISFAERLGKNEDARLASFVAKVSSLNSKLLIMTTREYILRDAERVYERLNALDRRMHFVLELADYTRGDRARILYNHLWHADVSRVALKEVASGGYQRIVDHPHYSPRLVGYCTSEGFDTRTPGYVDRFTETLSHPARLWKTAFDNHLTIEQRLLSVALATVPTPIRVAELREAHAALCKQLSIPILAASFRTALQVMEETFITIAKATGKPDVTFHNPSIREFTLDWLSEDPELVAAVVDSAPYFEQLRQIYTFATGAFGKKEAGARPSLKAILEGESARFKNALVRTIQSPCTEVRSEWGRNEGQVFRTKSSWFEDRITFVLSLDSSWIPSTQWIADLLETLRRRWEDGLGWKSEAVKLMNMLESITAKDLARNVLPEGVITRLAQVLEAWLSKELEETEEDWDPYLERLRDQGVELSMNDALVQRFESFARDELMRWSPSPPSIDQLREYAEEFGLGNLLQDIDEKIDEERERDRQTSSNLHRQPLSELPASLTDQDADKGLNLLFRRLIRLRDSIPE
jgi:hypothetical protein